MTGDPLHPNIVVVMTDQQRTDSIGCYGNQWVDTPNLDSLADSGTRFDCAYTPSAICAPARASVLTGVRPHKHGLVRNASESAIADEWPCFPQELADAGYRVGHAGKLHVGQPPKAFGMDGEHLPGWFYPPQNDAYRAYLDMQDLPYMNSDHLRDAFPGDGQQYQSGAIDDRPVEASYTHFITELARDLIAEYSESTDPFYLGVNYFGPHNPYYLPDRYANYYDPDDMTIPESAIKETFDDKPWAHRVQSEKAGLQEISTEEWRRMIAAYHGWVTFIDNEIGRLLQTLEHAGERENTLFVFTSDHGAFLTRHKMHDKGPAMYEDIYNVPMIVDGLIDDEAERVEERFVSLLDIAPTVLDAADRPRPPEYDGQSLFDLYRDDTDLWRERITAEFHGHFFAYEQRMIRDDRYKLVCNEHDIPELYDLQADPDELTNLVTDPAYGNVATRLYSELVDKLRKRGDGFLDGPTLKMSRTEDIGLEKYEAGSDSDQL